MNEQITPIILFFIAALPVVLICYMISKGIGIKNL